ncbi:MAG: ATP-binding protein, partial [Prevotella sp.]|nr:ATP-binding protein [Prevotella sp.]
SDDLTMLAIRYLKQDDFSVLDESLTLKNDIRQTTLLNSFMKDVLSRLGIDDKLARSIRLGVEEAVVNVMEYAYPNEQEGEVHIAARADGERLKLIVSDDGIPFDPTDATRIDTSLSAEERPIGGLGVHLIRELMDSINYERVDGRNVLTLSKNYQSN